MAAELAPSHADGTVCTDRAFRVRQVCVEKTEEEANFQSPSNAGYWRTAETQSRKI